MMRRTRLCCRPACMICCRPGPKSRRVVGQVGEEWRGAAGPAADVEAIAVAGEALATIGVPCLSVDITLPRLVPAVAEAYGIVGERAASLRAALDHKDSAAVAEIAGEAGGVLRHLLAPARPPPAGNAPPSPPPFPAPAPGRPGRPCPP